MPAVTTTPTVESSVAGIATPRSRRHEVERPPRRGSRRARRCRLRGRRSRRRRRCLPGRRSRAPCRGRGRPPMQADRSSRPPVRAPRWPRAPRPRRASPTRRSRRAHSQIGLAIVRSCRCARRRSLFVRTSVLQRSRRACVSAASARGRAHPARRPRRRRRVREPRGELDRTTATRARRSSGSRTSTQSAPTTPRSRTRASRTTWHSSRARPGSDRRLHVVRAVAALDRRTAQPCGPQLGCVRAGVSVVTVIREEAHAVSLLQ